jgi:peptidoglycan hydrolase CwlO-like protein
MKTKLIVGIALIIFITALLVVFSAGFTQQAMLQRQDQEQSQLLAEMAQLRADVNALNAIVTNTTKTPSNVSAGNNTTKSNTTNSTGNTTGTITKPVVTPPVVPPVVTPPIKPKPKPVTRAS